MPQNAQEFATELDALIAAAQAAGIPDDEIAEELEEQATRLKEDDDVEP